MGATVSSKPMLARSHSGKASASRKGTIRQAKDSWLAPSSIKATPNLKLAHRCISRLTCEALHSAPIRQNAVQATPLVPCCIPLSVRLCLLFHSIVPSSMSPRTLPRRAAGRALVTRGHGLIPSCADKHLLVVGGTNQYLLVISLLNGDNGAVPSAATVQYVCLNVCGLISGNVSIAPIADMALLRHRIMMHRAVLGVVVDGAVLGVVMHGRGLGHPVVGVRRRRVAAA